MELNKIGEVYANSKDDRNKIKKALEAEGFTIAYSMDTSLIIMEQIPALDENEE